MADADLVAAAENFGFNTDYSIGLDTATGSFPTPADPTEHAAAVIGQGKVTASPLHMATVGATVLDGTWEPPVLLPERDADDAPAATSLAAGNPTRSTGSCAGSSPRAAAGRPRCPAPRWPARPARPSTTPATRPHPCLVRGVAGRAVGGGAGRGRRLGRRGRRAHRRAHPRRPARVSWGVAGYVAAMTVLTPEARDVITAGRLAHLSTVNADGSPQVSIVWVGLDGDEIVSGHLGMRQKLRNVGANRGWCCRSRPGTATPWAWTSTWSCGAPPG